MEEAKLKSLIKRAYREVKEILVTCPECGARINRFEANNP